MPFSLRRLSKTQSLALGFTAIAVITILAWSGRDWRKTTPKAGSPTLPAAFTVQGSPQADPLIVEQLTLRPEGFYPAKLQRPKGYFLLAVNNRTGLREINLTLLRRVGSNPQEKLYEVKVERKKLDWSNLFDLQPGSYVLAEVSNPRWRCEITVTAQ